jgi:hypothetical protein
MPKRRRPVDVAFSGSHIRSSFLELQVLDADSSHQCIGSVAIMYVEGM